MLWPRGIPPNRWLRPSRGPAGALPPANNIVRLVRVPTPVPVAAAGVTLVQVLPWLGLVVAAGLVAYGAYQLWGSKNSQRPKGTRPEDFTATGTGIYELRYARNQVFRGKDLGTNAPIYEDATGYATLGFGLQNNKATSLQVIHQKQTVAVLNYDAGSVSRYVLTTKVTTEDGGVYSSNYEQIDDPTFRRGVIGTLTVTTWTEYIKINGAEVAIPVPPLDGAVPQVDKKQNPALPPAPPLVPPPAPLLPPPDTDPNGPGEGENSPGPDKKPLVPPFPTRIPGSNPLKPNEVTVIDITGKPVPKPLPPVQITPGDAHYPVPGGGPITGGGAAPNLQSIAQEVGRIENKLNKLLSPQPDTPVEWLDQIAQLISWLQSRTAEKTYKLTEQCRPNDPEYKPRTFEVTAPGADSGIGVLSNRIDALAALLNAQLGLEQQVCREQGQQAFVGRNISIQFRSTEISPWGDRRLRKAFRYRDPSLKPLEDHRDHWATFTWKSGPFMVISEGLDWGRPQVWAESEAEGKRVLTHAATIAGLDLADPKHKWTVREVHGARENPVLEMRVHRDNKGLLWIAERNQSAGFPEVLAEVSPDPRVGP